MILFGSGARGEADADSDLDFLVIERSVDDRIAEAVHLRRTLGDIGVPVDDRIAEAVHLRRTLGDISVPVDLVVLDEALAARHARVPGTMAHDALRDGGIIAES